MKTIILVGVPGSGKSSILKEIARKCPTVSIVNYGDEMLKEAQAEGLTRDMLRKLPIAEQQEVGIKAAKRIVHGKSGMTLIDTHALIKTPVGFCPGLPKEVLKILAPKALAWIDCPPEIIIHRRKNDASRTRDLESEDELAIHQELSHAYLAACSMETGSILCRILNRDPDIESNCRPFIHLIEQLS